MGLRNREGAFVTWQMGILAFLRLTSYKYECVHRLDAVALWYPGPYATYDRVSV